MFRYEIVILRFLAIGFIGAAMFFSLLFANSIFLNAKLLKKIYTEKKKSVKCGKSRIILMFDIALLVITASIFLIIKRMIRSGI